MGLRCSLFGHSFEEPVTERDRETRGAEVVITVRDVQTCRRCGAEQVIAENTEVRHLGSAEGAEEPESTAPDAESAPTAESTEEPAHDQPADEGEKAEPEDISKYVEAAEEPAGEPDEQPTVAEASDTDAPAEEDVEFIDDSDDEDTPEQAATESAGTDESSVDADTAEIDPDTAEDAGEEPTAAEAESEEPATDDDEPEEDDAIIMDNVAGEEDRQSDIGRRELAGSGNMFDASPPETGDGESVTPPQSEPEPTETEAEETYTDYPEPESEAEEAPTDASDQQWPGEDPDPVHEDSAFQFGPDMQATEDEDEEKQKSPSGLTTEGPVNVSDSASDSPPRSVICPECGYETRAVGSSLRAGDICPECHGGYLADRH